MKFHFAKAIVTFSLAYGVGEILDYIFYAIPLIPIKYGHIAENLITACILTATAWALGIFDDACDCEKLAKEK